MLFAVASAGYVYAGEPYKLKNEFSISWGFPGEDDWNDWEWDSYRWGQDTSTPLGRYNEGKYYYGMKEYTHAITVSYTNEMKKWLALSINATYSGVSRNEMETETDRIVDKYRKHRLEVFPMVRFTYLNRPVIRLYSALGFGFGMKSEKKPGDSYYANETYLGGHATFIGVSVGKKLFASWELGAGSKGVLNMSVGYRF